jgi:Mn2+/Fe2+ NRAMP family transporter
MTVLGLIGTTFVTSAAFYQSYLVRQKGWTTEQVKDGLIDTRVGACVMAAITLMLMSTPATLFYADFRHEQVVTDAGDSSLEKGTLVIDDRDPGTYDALAKKAADELDWETKKPRWPAIVPKSEFDALALTLAASDKEPVQLDARGFGKIPEVGMSLEPLFGGQIGPTLFFLGVFAAAYSSFLVNSMIGGFILADGLGLGSSPTDRWPKIFTIGVLLTGMGVGLYCIIKLENQSPVGLIVAAQAVTVLAAPLVGGTLLWLTCRRDIMGGNVNRPFVTALGVIGFLMLLAMSAKLALVDIPTKLDSLLNR